MGIQERMKVESLQERIERLEYYLTIFKKYNNTKKIRSHTAKLNRLKIIASRQENV
jgi:hypothetical protein